MTTEQENEALRSENRELIRELENIRMRGGPSPGTMTQGMAKEVERPAVRDYIEVKLCRLIAEIKQLETLRDCLPAVVPLKAAEWLVSKL